MSRRREDTASERDKTEMGKRENIFSNEKKKESSSRYNTSQLVIVVLKQKEGILNIRSKQRKTIGKGEKSVKKIKGKVEERGNSFLKVFLIYASLSEAPLKKLLTTSFGRRGL